MEYELVPKLLPGKLIEVTEIGVKIELKGRMGIIIVPLRCVITDKPLAVGLTVQAYLSYIQVL